MAAHPRDAMEGSERVAPLAQPEVATTGTDLQWLRDIDSRHEALQQVAVGALGTAAARELARLDAAAMNSFTDKSLQHSAAVVLGQSAEQYPSYKAALAEVAPSHARLAERAFADDVQKSAEKDDRKSFEFGERRDDAAKEIAARYATMKQAGLSVNDLSGSAVERLAVMDSRALLLLEGAPKHARETEASALVAESMKSPVYAAAFARETAEWRWQDTGRQADATASVSRVDAREQTAVAPSAAAEQQTPSKDVAEANTLRSVGDTAAKRPAKPPLEDRFNIKAGLLATEYRFRDQAGKVAFTEKMFSLHTSIDSAAAVKAMVERAAERGWQTVSLKGSAEFVRQGWIAAEARGLKSVGYTPTETDREAASKERTRMEAALQTEGSQQQREATASGQAERVDRAERPRRPGPIEQRQLDALIDKALIDKQVPQEIIEQVRAMARAQGAIRLSRGERFKVPVFDVKAPRARPKSVDLGPQRLSDRERSR